MPSNAYASQRRSSKQRLTSPVRVRSLTSYRYYVVSKGLVLVRTVAHKHRDYRGRFYHENTTYDYGFQLFTREKN